MDCCTTGWSPSNNSNGPKQQGNPAAILRQYWISCGNPGSWIQDYHNIAAVSLPNHPASQHYRNIGSTWDPGYMKIVLFHLATHYLSEMCLTSIKIIICITYLRFTTVIGTVLRQSCGRIGSRIQLYPGSSIAARLPQH